MNALRTVDRYFYKTLANNLNCKRIDKRKTFAEMSKETGLSKSTLDYIFLGKVRIKDEYFALICKSLGTDSESIIREIFC